jgi:ankyrin repeat protein
MLTHTERKLFSLILSDNINEFKENYQKVESLDKFCVNEDGLPLLAFAVQSAAPKVLDFLCDDSDLKGFNGPKGIPFSHYVVDHMDDEIVNLLQKHRFSFNEVDRFGKNVLHVAARVCEHDDFIKFIRLGADINLRSNRGETPKDTLKRWGNNKVKIRENIDELNH